MTIMRTIISIFIITFFVACGSDTEKEETGTGATEQRTDPLIVDTTPGLKKETSTYAQAYDRALVLWGIPFTEKDIPTTFGTAHVIIAGPENGEPLVLLHGMNASSTMWYPNVKDFTKQYRIYAIDFLMEPGKSVYNGGIDNTDQVISWYNEIFDQLKLTKFSIVGISRGGWLALNIALHDQSRINKLALLSPAQTFTWIKPNSEIVTNITYTVNPKREKLRTALETMMYDVDVLKQDYIDQYYIATKEATLSKMITQMTPFSEKELKSLSVPVLVLIGDTDIINSEKGLKRAKKYIPDVKTGEIKHAGHFLTFDQPEVVDKKILDFLNEKKDLSAKK